MDGLYLEAQQATEAGSKSFFFATRFFPKQLARHAYAVYWFCRTTDDLVDEAPSREVGESGLNQWEAELRFGLQGGNVSNPILRLFLHVVKECSIPSEYPLELIEGCRMDLEQHRYATYEEPERLAEGMRWVFVNGRAAIDNGKYTGQLQGRTLTRPAR